MKIKIVKDGGSGGWRWVVVGKSGSEMARSIWHYRGTAPAIRTVRRLFGPSVKVEVVK